MSRIELLRRMIDSLKTNWPSWAAAGTAAGLLVWAASSDRFALFLRTLLAHATDGILRLLGQATTVVGTTVQSSQFGITVVTACTGLFATGIFVIAVAAFPVRWRAKLVGFGIGIVGLFAINLLRLVSLYFIGVHWPRILDAAHLIVWQSLLIALAVALWLLWAGRTSMVRRGGDRR